MNEASVWRRALARKIALPYAANPKVSAAAVVGSAAQGNADRFSDIDLAIFWAEPPTDKERRDIVRRVRGRRGPLVPSHEEFAGSSRHNGLVSDVTSPCIRRKRKQTDRSEVYSTDIYDAVFHHGVRTLTEFDQYLRERGKPTRAKS